MCIRDRAFVDAPEITSDDKDYYEKMEYKLLPGPNKMLPKVFFAMKEAKTAREQRRKEKELNAQEEAELIRESLNLNSYGPTPGL